MNAGSRRAEFFALEAGEYLTELEQVVARSDTPDLERLVRGARALRGAALMAGLGTFARAAAALEGLARQVRDHALGWEPNARAGWREGLQTLRGLVGRAAGWEAADDRHALLLADRIERIGKGEAPAAAEPSTPTGTAAPGLTPGVRAFIARESALIAGSLQEAARALAPMDPPVALAGVLDRLRSLRGLGEAAELSPLPELLDAMEVTTRCLLRSDPAPPDVAIVFADAADALAAMAQAVADQGRIVVPNGLDRIARRLLEGFAAEADVLPIDALAPDGEAAIVTKGAPPAAPAPAEPVPVELVGVGDHLLMHAEALQGQGSPAARDLRLFVLHQTLTSMPARSRTGRFLAPLAGAIARAIGTGEAHRAPDHFVAMLRDCGRFLVEHGGDGTVATLTARRDAIARALGADDLIPRPVAALAPESDRVDVAPEATAQDLEPAPTASEPVVEIADLAPADEPAVIDIAELAPASPEAEDPAIIDIAELAPEAESPIVDIAALAPDEEPPVIDIARLAPDPSPDDDEVVEIAALAPDASAGGSSRLERAYRRLAELEAAAASADEPIEIGALVYRGDRALTRANEIRDELAIVLSATTVDLDRLRPLVDELLDLVPLARDAA
ncbi:MAG: Hpt domain-containing protein [Gemmatimonadetes bacterium]|nr:Hpt domain-containing protein [Gemmatimonadota bacterium]